MGNICGRPGPSRTGGCASGRHGVCVRLAGGVGSRRPARGVRVPCGAQPEERRHPPHPARQTCQASVRGRPVPSGGRPSRRRILRTGLDRGGYCCALSCGPPEDPASRSRARGGGLGCAPASTRPREGAGVGALWPPGSSAEVTTRIVAVKTQPFRKDQTAKDRAPPGTCGRTELRECTGAGPCLHRRGTGRGVGCPAGVGLLQGHLRSPMRRKASTRA